MKHARLDRYPLLCCELHPHPVSPSEERRFDPILARAHCQVEWFSLLTYNSATGAAKSQPGPNGPDVSRGVAGEAAPAARRSTVKGPSNHRTVATGDAG